MSRHLSHLDGQTITVWKEDDAQPCGMRQESYEFSILRIHRKPLRRCVTRRVTFKNRDTINQQLTEHLGIMIARILWKNETPET